MATIIAHITIRAGEEARFEAIARSLYHETHDTESRVLRYEYFRGAEPRTYYTLLAYPDEAAFLEHQTSGHHERAAPELGRIIESIRLEWVDPVRDAAPLEPTEAGARSAGIVGTAASDDGVDQYRARVADWWHELRTEEATT